MALDLSFPRDIFMDMYLKGDWREVTNDVRQSSPISIDRGKKDEGSKPTPSKLMYVLDDSASHGNGDYNPENPNGQWFPDFDRNIPTRYGLKVGTDDFTRANGAGWGNSPQNGAWTLVQQGSLAINSNAGTHTLTAASQAGFAELQSVSARDVEITFTASMDSLSNVTGGFLVPWGVVLRSDGNFFYYLRIEISTAEAVTLRWYYQSYDGDTADLIAGPVTLSTVYSGGNWKIRAQADNFTLRGKAWDADNPEPVGWDLEAVDKRIRTPGWVGIRNATGLGNTNVPVTYRIDNFNLRLVRFAGETSRVVPGRDLSGKIRWTNVECGTVFRRIEQRKSLAKSPMRRAIENTSSIVAYYPFEDGKASEDVASGLKGKPPMRSRGGRPAFQASEDIFYASAPLPTMEYSDLIAEVPPYTVTGSTEFRWLMHLPGNQTPFFVIDLYFTGSCNRWTIEYNSLPDQTLVLKAYDDQTNVLFDDSSVIITDLPLYLDLTMTQSGSDINYNFAILHLGRTSVTTYASGTIVGKTVGRVVYMGIYSGVSDGTSVAFVPRDFTFGHFTAGNSNLALSNAFDYFNGFPEETTSERIERLILENALPSFANVDSSVVTGRKMGPQVTDTLGKLFEEITATGGGVYGDSRAHNCHSYKEIELLFDQVPILTLDYADGVIAPDFQPMRDDQYTQNDVTAKARLGGEFQVEKEEGDLNVNDPGTVDGAVGRYDGKVEVNPFKTLGLQDAANWALHLGTVKEPRFPDLTINLRASEVSQALQQAILDTDLGDVFSLENLEDWYIYDTIRQLCQGYREIYLNSMNHSITFTGVPASPYDVFNLTDDELILDSATSTLNEDLDTTETSIEVAFTSARWILSTDVIPTNRCINQGTPITDDYVIGTTSDALGTRIGDKAFLYNSNGVLKEATEFEVIDNTVTAGGFTNIQVDQNFAATPVAGDVLKTVIANNFNFDIVIGGERMTVTNITGSTSPQTFTVIRSVNGVVKSHSTGDKVQLFRPAFLG